MTNVINKDKDRARLNIDNRGPIRPCNGGAQSGNSLKEHMGPRVKRLPTFFEESGLAVWPPAYDWCDSLCNDKIVILDQLSTTFMCLILAASRSKHSLGKDYLILIRN